MNSKPTFVHSGLLQGLLPTVRQGGGRGDPKGRLFLSRTGLDGCVHVSYHMWPHTDTYTGQRAEITVLDDFLGRLTVGGPTASILKRSEILKENITPQKICPGLAKKTTLMSRSGNVEGRRG
jgi:hypothetical protein